MYILKVLNHNISNLMKYFFLKPNFREINLHYWKCFVLIKLNFSIGKKNNKIILENMFPNLVTVHLHAALS